MGVVVKSHLYIPLIISIVSIASMISLLKPYLKQLKNLYPRLSLQYDQMTNTGRQMRQSDILCNKAKNKHLPKHWRNYKTKRNEVVQLVREATQTHMETLKNAQVHIHPLKVENEPTRPQNNNHPKNLSSINITEQDVKDQLDTLNEAKLGVCHYLK